MRISLGIRLRKGPWGGGNQFGWTLARFLEDRGCRVSYDLRDNDLDVIVLIDPRRQSQTASYGPHQILNYRRLINPRAVVVHRVNECDERKGTTDVNRQLIEANRCADQTVFVSQWLYDLFDRHGWPCENNCVIRNGSDQHVFHPLSRETWQGNRALRLVTHHWGANHMKGFDIYKRVDELLENGSFNRRIDFTYVGNLPVEFRFRNARYVSPKFGSTLANELRRHDVYLTASRNEPGGNHQNEGACCGLPLLYRNSGCLPEYCNGFGIMFEDYNFQEKLEQMLDTYDSWVARMLSYPHTASRMCDSYWELFSRLVSGRQV